MSGAVTPLAGQLTRRRLLPCLLVLLANLPPATSFGQAGWRAVLPPMTDQDFELAARTARDDMTGRNIGTRLQWQNPDSGSQGSVELMDRFERDQRECRTLRHDVKVPTAGAWSQTVTICRQADGSWQAAPARQQAP